jgi:hypothetical protein
MDIKEYREKVIDCLRNLPELKDAVVSSEDVVKSNDTTLNAISIRKDKDSHLGVNLYVEEYFRLNMDPENAAEDILRIYNDNINNKTANDISSLIDIFKDFDKLKDKISIRVFNKNRNSSFTEGCPYLVFGDLVVMFYVNVTDCATAKVNNSMMKEWNIPLNDLISVGFENTRKLYPLKINGIFNTLLEMRHMSKEEVDNYSESLDDADKNMFVVSNNYDAYGAFYIADKFSLNQIYNTVKSDFIIIPSSVHELIVVPFPMGPGATVASDDKNEAMKALNEMVGEVNRTTLHDSDVLSDHVYFYNGTEQRLYDDKDHVIPFVY